MQLRINKNLFKFCSACGLRIVSRMIAVYLTSKNGETDRKQTQKGADKNTCVGKFKRQALSKEEPITRIS